MVPDIFAAVRGSPYGERQLMQARSLSRRSTSQPIMHIHRRGRWRIGMVDTHCKMICE